MSNTRPDHSIPLNLGTPCRGNARRRSRRSRSNTTGRSRRSTMKTGRHFGLRIADCGLTDQSEIRNPNSAIGMTLVELLVAFMVLLMLVGALVALTTRSLQTWSTGETRKEMYDRAQVVLDALVRDVRNTYVETEIYDDGR